MRILQVATLVTPDGAFGGPIRVALNQLSELQDRGHDVQLVAGHSGFDGTVPTSMSGVPVKLFPVTRRIPRTGFAGLTSAPMRGWLAAQAPRTDVAHVHLARDLVTLPAARVLHRAGVPFVAQTHGMIDASSKPLAHVLDAVLTDRMLAAARSVLFLTSDERHSLVELGRPESQLHQLINGVPAAVRRSSPPDDHIEVLFLARLQTRKRPDQFVRAGIALASKHPDVTFTLVGPDQGMGLEIERLISESGLSDRIRWEGPVSPDSSLERMSRAAIYVLPAVDEPFPMAVLEALSLSLPVVITDTCGLAAAVAGSGAGVVVDDDTLDSLVAAVDHLLSDRQARQTAASRAGALAAQRFSMSAVVDDLEHIYAGALRETAAAT